MLKRSITICLAVAALGAGLAACGGSDEPEAAAPKAPATATPAETPAATPEAASGSANVSVQDNSYAPGDLEVAVGDTVTFENEGAIAHTVTASDGADFDSGSLEPGATFEWTAKKAGDVTYVCTFHPGMQGTITVN